MSTRVKISANLIQAGANNSFNTFRITHINLICSQSTLQIRKGVLINSKHFSLRHQIDI